MARTISTERCLSHPSTKGLSFGIPFSFEYLAYCLFILFLFLYIFSLSDTTRPSPTTESSTRRRAEFFGH